MDYYFRLDNLTQEKKTFEVKQHKNVKLYPHTTWHVTCRKNLGYPPQKEEGNLDSI